MAAPVVTVLAEKVLQSAVYKLFAEHQTVSVTSPMLGVGGALSDTVDSVIL